MPVEYIVDTTCGRHFCWSATNYSNLLLSLQDNGYTPTFIMPKEEYDALEQAKEERELKESA
ncbi:hypothetical protein [Paenibacillus apii]|uniref:hypothetical protein n=1 Tax=Paenibacillus apii TaxID=1850370 RepID=UPI001438737F|nr:hypothetical protein [Paenibacillus apii]NJJ38580.1 hypothetical protein [Paenibacillus apii]